MSQSPAAAKSEPPTDSSAGKERWFLNKHDDPNYGVLRYDRASTKVHRMKPNGEMHYECGYTIEQLTTDPEFFETDRNGVPLSEGAKE